MEIKILNSELKCPVCAQISVSIKSLYGHMRNHPERNWRGIKHPIPDIKNNQFSSLPVSGLESDGNTHPGPGLLFPGWSKTSRRTKTRPGKSLMTIPASNQAISYDFPELENGERVTENLPPKKRKLESALSSNAGNSNSRRRFPNRPLIIHGGGGFSRSGNQNDIGNLENIDKISNPGPESSRKEKDLVLNDKSASKNPARARKNHVCDECNRVFKSYQALGGHKSHHNNKAHEIMSIGEDNESLTTVVNSVVVNGERRCGVVHRCPFCNKKFSKGQALGGHKRHCRRTMYSEGRQETSNEPTNFSFDLNELPPEWVPDKMGTSVACEWSVAYK